MSMKYILKYLKYTLNISIRIFIIVPSIGTILLKKHLAKRIYRTKKDNTKKTLLGTKLLQAVQLKQCVLIYMPSI